MYRNSKTGEIIYPRLSTLEALDKLRLLTDPAAADLVTTFETQGKLTGDQWFWFYTIAENSYTCKFPDGSWKRAHYTFVWSVLAHPSIIFRSPNGRVAIFPRHIGMPQEQIVVHANGENHGSLNPRDIFNEFCTCEIFAARYLAEFCADPEAAILEWSHDSQHCVLCGHPLNGVYFHAKCSNDWGLNI